MAVAMNKELLALRDAGCRCIQIEEPTLHFMANTFGAKHEKVKFMVECYNREVQGLDDVEIWIHTCWGNPNMQRVMEDTSYRASFELYLNELRGDVWTIETKDRNFKDIELFGAHKGKLPKKICIGAVSHRTLQADRAGGRRRRDPHGAEAHRARAADRVERLRLRPPGLQPRDRVLQGQRDRAGLQHRPQGARTGARPTFRRRIPVLQIDIVPRRSAPVKSASDDVVGRQTPNLHRGSPCILTPDFTSGATLRGLFPRLAQEADEIAVRDGRDVLVAVAARGQDRRQPRQIGDGLDVDGHCSRPNAPSRSEPIAACRALPAIWQM